MKRWTPDSTNPVVVVIAFGLALACVVGFACGVVYLETLVVRAAWNS